MEVAKPLSMDERQQALFDSCLPFAYQQAHSFFHRHQLGRRLGDIHDVEQEAMIGLAIATLKWDPNHPSGAAFITYANYAIRSCLLKGSQVGGLIGLPTQVTTPVNLERSSHALNVHQLILVEDVDDDEMISKKTMSVISTEPDCDERALRQEEMEELRRAMRMLPSKERYIMVRRRKGWTLRRIASVVGVSKERIRQLEKRAMAKLRRLLVKGEVAA